MVRTSYRGGIQEIGSIRMNQKKLISYFSWSGNTAALAKLIQKETGAELFEITTIKPYPEDYYETTRVSKDEL